MPSTATVQTDEDYFAHLVEQARPVMVATVNQKILDFVTRIHHGGVTEVVPITDETRLPQLKEMLRVAAVSLGRRSFTTIRRDSSGALTGLQVTIGATGGRRRKTETGVEIGSANGSEQTA